MGQAKRRREEAELKQATRRRGLRGLFLPGGVLTALGVALTVGYGLAQSNAAEAKAAAGHPQGDNTPAIESQSELAGRSVQVYVGGDEPWREAKLADVGKQAEFIFEGQLATFRSGALGGVPGVTEVKVREALRTFNAQRGPDSDDAVSLLSSDGRHERFCLLGDAPLNRRFVFQHAIYTMRAGANADEGVLERLGLESAPPSKDPLDEDITPATWRSASFVMNKPDGSRVDVSLLRPLWWLERNGVAVGKQVDLDLSEFGAAGPALVTSVGPCDVDSKNSSPGTQVVIGKFTHESDNVWNVYFNEDPKPLGATGNHPIFSRTRRTWVPASSLSPGEEVDTLDGREAVVARLEPLAGRHTVYNLEVHRDHTFFVAAHEGAPSIWVHNACGFERLTPGRRNPTAAMGDALSPSEAKFRDLVFEGKPNLQVYRTQSGGGLGDFVLVDRSNPSRPIGLAVELYNPAEATGVAVRQAGAQVRAAELAGIQQRLGLHRIEGIELSGPNRFGGVGASDLGSVLQGEITRVRGR